MRIECASNKRVPANYWNGCLCFFIGLLNSILNSVGNKLPHLEDDFFTELSFSTLLGELTDKENFSWNFESQPVGEARVRIKADFERVWHGKEDHNFLNRIFK